MDWSELLAVQGKLTSVSASLEAGYCPCASENSLKCDTEEKDDYTGSESQPWELVVARTYVRDLEPKIPYLV